MLTFLHLMVAPSWPTSASLAGMARVREAGATEKARCPSDPLAKKKKKVYEDLSNYLPTSNNTSQLLIRCPRLVHLDAPGEDQQALAANLLGQL